MCTDILGILTLLLVLMSGFCVSLMILNVSFRERVGTCISVESDVIFLDDKSVVFTVDSSALFGIKSIRTNANVL